MSEDLHAAAARRLNAVGQRYTPGRRLLVDLLDREGDPLTLPEILDLDAALAQSSAYRNLTVLERAGVVAKVITTGDWGRYEIAEDLRGHHHHLICSSCGAVRDVDVSPELETSLDEALQVLAGSLGFVLQHHRLDLVGLCGRCADRTG